MLASMWAYKHRVWSSQRKDTVECRQKKKPAPTAESDPSKIRLAITSKWKHALAAKACITITLNARKNTGRYTKKRVEICIHHLRNLRQPQHLQRDDQHLNTVPWIQSTSSWLADSKSWGRKEYLCKKPWREHVKSFSHRTNPIWIPEVKSQQCSEWGDGFIHRACHTTSR